MSSTASEASSAVFSMYSQSMTRESSGVDTSLTTPSDELSSYRFSKPGMLGPRVMRGYSTTTRVSASETNTRPREDEPPLRALHQITEQDPEPPRPNFSLPRDSEAGSNHLRHQRSTKVLINRYESMTSGSRHLSSDVRSPAYPPLSTKYIQQPRSAAMKKEKGHSPIRRSIQNFLSVFKKAKGLGRDADECVPAAMYISDLLGPPISSTEPLDDKPVSASIVMDRKSDTGLQRLLYSGPLLYLSRSPDSPSSPILPVWITCTTSLHSDRILATWLSFHGNPSTHTIPLSRCTDVCSIAQSELSDNERALLPEKGDTGELKVFEIQFDGKPKEKFAATSVQDRASWVGAIWDAILRTQELKECRRLSAGTMASRGIQRLGIVSESSAEGQPLPNPTETAYPIAHYRAPTMRTERDLPPTPTPFSLPVASNVSQHIAVALYDPPLLRPPISPSESSSYRSKSPSIANLGKMSMVKHRLAQIERNNSLASSEGSPTPSGVSRRSSNTLPAPLTPTSTRSQRLRAAFLDIERLERQGSFRTECSVGEPDLENVLSPPSVRAGQFAHLATLEIPFRFAETPSSTISRRSHSGVSMRSSVREHIPVPTPDVSIAAVQVVAGVEPGAGPPVDPVHDKAIHQTADFEGLTVPLSDDARALIKQTVSVAGESHPSGNVFGALEVIGEAIDVLERHAVDSGGDLKYIRQKVDTFGQHAGCPQVSEMAQTLQELRSRLCSDVPSILETLEEMKLAGGAFPHQRELPPLIMNNLAPPASSPQSRDEGASRVADLSQIDGKLDELMVFCRQHGTDSDTIERGPGGSDVSSETPLHANDILKEVLDLLKTDEAKHALQAEQQTDSVRYLNELNSWLEAFVNNGTSQIQVVATCVQQLCKELGIRGPEGGPGGSQNLLANVKQLLIENRERGGNGLKESVDVLTSVVQEDLQRNAQIQNAFNADAITALIDRQRQDQENMLRALATELSNDIRGERLRFVDAMKEATAINVQAHVEQFKKELTREVALMTQEVGRLHREKQLMEQHIADLFAFYSKQKQATTSSLPSKGRTGPQQSLRQMPQPTHVAPHRPLPIPIPGATGSFY